MTTAEHTCIAETVLGRFVSERFRRGILRPVQELHGGDRVYRKRLVRNVQHQRRLRMDTTEAIAAPPPASLVTTVRPTCEFVRVCADPTAAYHAESFYALYADYTGGIEVVASGSCTIANNNADCRYDGGDCCPSTCVSTESYNCSTETRDCVDPLASDFAEEYYVQYENCSATIEHIGDGNCTAENNDLDCGYDGGDCCPSTCELEDCWSNEIRHWIDPNATDYNPNARADYQTAYPSCEDVSGIADGVCNVGNNNPACGYNGGDCCACTCTDANIDDALCSESTFADCTDPNAADAAYGLFT